jgi:hypothetical protein
METTTPTEVATALWGRAEAESHSAGARSVRKIARRLFPRPEEDAYKRWHFTPDQVLAIKRDVQGQP